ncbi:MAG TPA: PspC domain-containing protein [Sphingomicrobium sp.]|jgi:phage shock protein C|nr:PspC domain-containing protein [Sphingomicrobium sp.]
MQDQTPPQPSTAAEPPAALLLRDDTILGVCQGIGEDFGFSPTWLRVAFAAMLFVQPLWTIAAYLALGLLVAASRLLFPDGFAAAATTAPAEAIIDGAIAPSPGEALDDPQGNLPLAA